MSEQPLQYLLTAMGWDEQALTRPRIAQMLPLSQTEDGVLILADTGFDKKGRCAAGVARQ
jgi:SRSO17 transposase